MNDKNTSLEDSKELHKTARLILVVFILTFIASRVLVFLIMEKKIDDLYLYIGQTHVHHLNYGIFLLSFIGGYLLLLRPKGRAFTFAVIVYAVGLALTFDEFGMWLHLGGGYWQRVSFDAITMIAAVFALIVFAPKLRYWRAQHYWMGLLLIIIIPAFFFMLFRSLHTAEAKLEEHMEKAGAQLN